MNQLFYIDVKSGVVVSWEQLVEDINSAQEIDLICQSDDHYGIYLQIVLALLSNEPIVLLDEDLSIEQRSKLNLSAFQSSASVAHIHVDSPEHLIKKLRAQSSTAEIVLFTSGTTGVPKSVKQKISTLNRYIKVGEAHKNDIWGLAYSPTHIAGVQVFMQFLLNQNTGVRLFRLGDREIITQIHKQGVTHLSATPTFYRLIRRNEVVSASLLRLSSGGEKFDENMAEALRIMFPEARIYNIYASTEAGTLFASSGSSFVIKPELADKVRVDAGELLINKELMGESGEMLIEGDWYRTGDMVEVLSASPLTIKFISRNSDVITVGGFQVNLIEVEQELLNLRGVKTGRVFSRSSSVVGNILCCEVVKGDAAITESYIRLELAKKLQDFKVPRIVRFVGRIANTSTGKTSRN